MWWIFTACFHEPDLALIIERTVSIFRIWKRKRWRTVRRVVECTQMSNQCCQLLAKLSGQSNGKIRLLRKKFGPLINLTFWRHLGWVKILLFVSSALICTELERIRGEKQIFKNLGPFSAFSKQNRQKFGRSFVRPLYFLFGPFWVMPPGNNRPAGNTVSNVVKRLCCGLYAAVCATTVKTCVLYIAGLLLLALLFVLMGMISSRQGSHWSGFFF